MRQNEQGRLAAPPPTSPTSTLAQRRDGGLRLAIVAALEALEAADQNLACEILLSALEDGPRERRFACPECTFEAECPGLLQAHQLARHELAEAA